MTWRGVNDPNDDLDALIDGYFRDQKILAVNTAAHVRDRTPVAPGEPLPGYDGRLFDWLTEMLNFGPNDGPEQAWPVILELVARAPDENALTFIGSGALEDLVNNAGAQFIDRFQAQSAVDPRFRRAIRNVWFHPDVPEGLRALIAAARADPALGPWA